MNALGLAVLLSLNPSERFNGHFDFSSCLCYSASIPVPEPDSSSHPVLDQGLTTDEQEQQDWSRREDDYQEQIHRICQSLEIP